jgi:hypothetical protein
MLKKVEARCKRCGNEFCRKIRAGILLSAMPECVVEKASKKTPQGLPHRGSFANGPFSPIKTVACKAPQTPDFAFIRAQIATQRDKPNPISFSFPDGSKEMVWLASDRHGAKLIGDDRHWRVNVADLLKLSREKRHLTFGGLWPRHCAGQSSSLVAMTQFKTGTTHFSR